MPPDTVFTSTTSPLKRRKRFSICCPGIRHSFSLVQPTHEEVAILIRIFQRNKATAPTFVQRRLNVRTSCDQIFVKLIDVFNTDKKVTSASAAQHRLEVLCQRDSQRATAKSRH